MTIRNAIPRPFVFLILGIACVSCQPQDEASLETKAPSLQDQPLSENDLLESDKVAHFRADRVEVTPEEEATYGRRAATIAWRIRRGIAVPDLDWRDTLNPSLATEEPMWSQTYEELVIRDFFGDKEGGYFLDVGCHLAKYNSTTYYLERMLGWTGIGIDAMDHYAAEWAEQRPGSIFIANAVSDKDGEELTFHLGNAVDSLDEDIVTSFGGKRGEIQVITVTINSVLEKYGIEKLDFLNLDIEGAEPYALKGFDIGRYKPELCCVEGKSKEVLEYFEAHNYELIEKYNNVDKVNRYFRPKSSE